MLSSPKFMPIAVIAICILLLINLGIAWFRPSIIAPRHVQADSLILTKDGDLEIRTTSADQRVFYRRAKTDKREPVMCSEPSPDATLDTEAQGNTRIEAALARGAGVSGNLQTVQGQVATTNAVFTRSQSVQFLRDSMYFLCQAHLNDKLNDEAYMKKFDDLIKRSYDLLNTELRVREAVATGKSSSGGPESPQALRRK